MQAPEKCVATLTKDKTPQNKITFQGYKQVGIKMYTKLNINYFFS